MSFKTSFKILFLLFTTWSLLATSTASSYLSYGDFNIKSDCSGTLMEADITVSAGQITSPPATVYSDFGFPIDTVNDDTVTGTVGAATRVCRVTYGGQNSTDHVFSCFDDGAYVCTIFLGK